jgi:predicted aldo/keto reductase-like oxidoreductase
LKRLKRDCIDLVQFHGTSYDSGNADAILRSGGLLYKMLEAKRDGLIKFVGFTTEDNNRAVYDFMDSENST